ncbi:MAG: RidA family protein [Segetibacter sp.]|jgi:2-iminobutanoate/2-iminopropanoate deaminase|nr:RidA family protein [Segetibacter sp.]
MDKRVIQTSKAPAPIGPYSQAIVSNNMLFISGQIPVNPATNELVSGDVAVETHQVMRNLHEILEEAGINFNHVLKSTIFLSDMSLFAAVNEVYGSYFAADYPARETVAVKGLPKSVNVEISMIATM